MTIKHNSLLHHQLVGAAPLPMAPQADDNHPRATLFWYEQLLSLC